MIKNMSNSFWIWRTYFLNLVFMEMIYGLILKKLWASLTSRMCTIVLQEKRIVLSSMLITNAGLQSMFTIY